MLIGSVGVFQMQTFVNQNVLFYLDKLCCYCFCVAGLWKYFACKMKAKHYKNEIAYNSDKGQNSCLCSSVRNVQNKEWLNI